MLTSPHGCQQPPLMVDYFAFWPVSLHHLFLKLILGDEVNTHFSVVLIKNGMNVDIYVAPARTKLTLDLT